LIHTGFHLFFNADLGNKILVFTLFPKKGELIFGREEAIDMKQYAKEEDEN